VVAARWRYVLFAAAVAAIVYVTMRAVCGLRAVLGA
jgi:hypothetical protein